LRIDEGDRVVLAGINLLAGAKIQTEVIHHRSVFAAADHPAVGDRALHIAQRVGQSAERRRRGDAVRIGVVLHQDQ